MAMFDEEPILTHRAQTLDQMSIEDLRERIRMLSAGIADCEREISRKEAQKSAADALFGTKS
ncbi:DUF1192 family protein [Hyphomonas sp.]|uniref:DUF1192 family protein n=1 Tax=Hyphomonas sp. TaxID=87 RepID=UPI003F727A3F|tara:strand:- start:1653 stop:1838 length:186 start_codon:yes stop_codon:yes gene_type:complete